SRFIQLRSILRHGDASVEHRFPIGHHFVTAGGKTHSMYSPVFAYASAPLFRIFGYWGLFVLPIAGTLLLIALLPNRIGLIVFFATPVLWYTLVFWEHTLAAALALAAFVLCGGGRPRPPGRAGHPASTCFLAGILVAASTLLREEGYIA